jgi:hypothetical protein
MPGIPKVATGAGVCCSNKLKIAGETIRTVNAYDTHFFVFQRLPERLQDTRRELWQLVEEQDTSVCKGYFPWQYRSSSSHHASKRDGVMRRAKRALPACSGLIGGYARNRVNQQGFYLLFIAKRRQYRRHTFGEHRLARTRRANHEQPMTSCCGYYKGTLSHFLIDHVDVVESLLSARRALHIVKRVTDDCSGL